ncbi:MAG: precorrin-2 C(20)-methyltransferase [Deltaproteobacteria bacterium GWC2_56_8]|nr:MAG: precorrin-2 C(20)-methyltransferase [Deltaproteobacteria bacterium GWB2_55_19]OGP38922.1 MAG: precorrin-2 C(20)-methyltransferase [Deltaproteobacteria bacterium GWC2_56_8]
MTQKTGTLYGVGVGPGDPELLTLKALRVLKEAAVLAYPKSSETASENESKAYSIVRAAGVEGNEPLELLFPMTKDSNALQEAREVAAASIIERLKQGKDVAFITLGDPMLYSTFSYLVPLVKEAGAEVRSVPGVTSFSAAASAALVPLAESDERVVVMPASAGEEEIRRRMGEFDSVVLMKAGKALDRIIDLALALGVADSSVFASRVGWKDEEVVRGIGKLKGRKAGYFSMVILRKARA